MKRFFDLLVVIATMPLWIPTILMLAVIVRIALGTPVFFRQARPGKNGRIFQMIKFRSMTSETDSDGNILDDAKRLTQFGRILRSTSLDELPELWNVLRGDMSLIGPRPLLIEYLPLYTAEQSRRHEVKPGITGWAQVNGRNNLDWPERLMLDVWYVDNQSLILDIKIIFMTFWKVFKREGISAPTQATMTKFEGKK